MRLILKHYYTEIMKAIKKGDKGAEVTKWQNFLYGIGYTYVVADGDFGKNTHNASVDFEQKNGLIANGIIDNATYFKAMQLGFQLVNDVPVKQDEYTSGWPAPPDFKSLSASDVQSLFGPVEYKVLPDGNKVEITNNWAAENIVTVQIPQIKH